MVVANLFGPKHRVQELLLYALLEEIEVEQT
jgi:hypothetical protein